MVMQQEVPWLDDDEQTLWRAMMDAAKAVERAMDTRLLATEEISSADFSVLVQLSEAEGGTVRMRELCEASGGTAAACRTRSPAWPAVAW